MIELSYKFREFTLSTSKEEGLYIVSSPFSGESRFTEAEQAAGYFGGIIGRYITRKLLTIINERKKEV